MVRLLPKLWLATDAIRPSKGRRYLRIPIRRRHVGVVMSVQDNAPVLPLLWSDPVLVHRIIRPVRPVDPGDEARLATGITGDTISDMAMTLRLDEAEAEALRRRAERERRSMQDVARQAIREYIEEHSRAELLDRVLDEELPRYAEALERLGQ
jgi:predicted transcriptional regulator